MSSAFGQSVSEQDLTTTFLDGPGQAICVGLLTAMGNVPQFVDLFGHYTPGIDEQRWADYKRIDWSVRQLPCLNLFESETETKESAYSFLNGTLQMQVFWPASLRRSDLTRVPKAFESAMLNFFESSAVYNLLDEQAGINRPGKIPGLNQIGAQIDWVPDVEGMVDSQQVPVTVLNIRYRVDLREWYRYLETEGRTEGTPFEVTIQNLAKVTGNLAGTEKPDNADHIDIVVPLETIQTN